MHERMLAELAALIERNTGGDGTYPTEVAPLFLTRATAPSEPVRHVCEPALCLVARGRKRVTLADEEYVYDSSHFLLVSVGLPIVGKIIEASAERPYLSLRIDLELARVGELLIDMGAPSGRRADDRRGLAVSVIDAPLLDAVTRYVGLLDRPSDIEIMAPLIMREILYRLLVGEQGPRLRRIAVDGGQSRRIALAIDRLRRDFAQAIRIEEVAREVHMSPSAFHEHFKAVTAMSPLQYQKRLRLQEARKLMLGEGLDAAAAAYRVGYESASQFSREYRRCFGEPPRRDMARLRREPPRAEA